MPEQEAQTVEKPTAMAEQLKATTDSAIKAVTGGGFNDPDFERSLQEAIDKDAGKLPVTPPADVEKPAAPPVEKKEATIKPAVKAVKVEDDIPAELLGEKKADKPAEPAPDEAAIEAERQKNIEEQTKGMTPKAAERFRKIEARAAEAEARARKIEAERNAEKATLQKQVEELSLKIATKAAENTEAERLRKQVEELEAVVSKSALQDDPRFKAAYDVKIAAEIDKISKAVPQENAEEMAQLAALPESKRRNERIMEIAESLTDLQKVKLLAAIERVDGLSTEKAEQLAKWKENKIHVEAEEIRKRENAMANQADIQKVAWVKGMSAVSSPETGLEVFRKAEGNDEWNSKVDSRIAEVQRILTDRNMPPEKLVEIAARSVASEDYRRMFLAQRILVRRLTDEIASLTKAEPNAAEGSGGDAATEDNDGFITSILKGTLKSGALR